jgi:hypothetical protein
VANFCPGFGVSGAQLGGYLYLEGSKVCSDLIRRFLICTFE